MGKPAVLLIRALLGGNMNQNTLLAMSLTLSALISTTAHADPARTITADLDRDGRPETFVLSDNGQSLTTLTIRRPGKSTIVARDIAWSLEPANLTRAPNGSVLLNSSHIGVGRSPHEQTLTIAYRAGTYQVVGLTRGTWDRIEPDSSTSCDLNLLTGQGKVNGRPVRRALRAKAVTAWNWDMDLPAGCSIP
jgi:hypothetical protein